MKESTLFNKAEFVKSAKKAQDYPILKDDLGKPLPEVAVVGRSNVGKSTLLNRLFGTRKLVKTSATPGKTQLINFFVVDKKLLFVDLPGYGFANVSLKVRQQWGPMVQHYLEKRESLSLIIFLFDVRRTPNDEDRELLQWAAFYQKPIILILTKIDKIGKSSLKTRTEGILQSFGYEEITYLHFSAPKNIGRRELIKEISQALHLN